MPLALPMFTFLYGNPGCGQRELAQALAAQDEDLLPLDLENPLHSATQEMFLADAPEMPNLNDAAIRAKKIPGTDVTIADWLVRFEIDLRNIFGLSALGKFALTRWRQDGEDTIFARFLYCDCHNLQDIEPFAAAYGADSCLCIHLGQLISYNIASPIRHIWLAHTELSARLAMLRRELEPAVRPEAEPA